MQIPPGMYIKSVNQVCQLNKSLYRLKQANRQRYDKFSTFLLSQGYTRSNVDHSLFLKNTNDSSIVVLVYVYDIILAGNSIIEIENLTNILIQLSKLRILEI